MNRDAKQMIDTPLPQLVSGETAFEKSLARRVKADAFEEVGDLTRACILRGADAAIRERQSGMNAVTLWRETPSNSQPGPAIVCSGSIHHVPLAISGSAAIAADSQWNAAIVMSGDAYTYPWASGQTWRLMGRGALGKLYGRSQVGDDVGRLLDAEYAKRYDMLTTEGISITSGL